MEGITILATKNIYDFGAGSVCGLIIGFLLILLGIIVCCFSKKSFFDWAGAMACAIGLIINLSCLLYMFIPVEAYIATIEDTVPYKYIEKHYNSRKVEQ